MKELFELFWLFAKMGSITFGGGYAMLPILQRELVEKRGWVTNEELADYYAVGQCTPGIIAVNTSTFIGEKRRGVVGGIASTLGFVFPSIIIILVIAKFLQRFRQSRAVDAVFYGLRAASVALITAALLQVAAIALLNREAPFGPAYFNFPAIILAAVIFALITVTPAKKLHPICFIGLAALTGIIFKM